MGRRSTHLKIIFFGLLLAGVIVIQYCWVRTLQKDKEQKYKYLLISGIQEAANGNSFAGSPHQLSVTAMAKGLRRSFTSKGLDAIHFEFKIGSGNDERTSPGFPGLMGNTNNLTLDYLIQGTGKMEISGKHLTVIIPHWKSFIWRQMTWIIAVSVLLTIMILVIFYCAAISGGTGQLFYKQRTNAINNLMQQLEAPLSTVSVAAEALRNARVSRDPGKINYYQRVIEEENRHMNEQVERFLRELK